MRSIFLGVVTFIYCLGTSAQQWKYYSIENGLSNNYINDILQDDNGYLWISTIDGLNRFDGVNFEVFRNNPEDPNSIEDNIVHHLIKNKKNDIFLTTERLVKYNQQQEKFKALFTFNVLFGYIALYDTNGIVSIGNNHLTYFSYATEDTVSIDLTVDTFSKRIAVDSSGHAWLVADKRIYRFDLSQLYDKTKPARCVLVDSLYTNIKTLFTDFRQVVWLNGSEGDYKINDWFGKAPLWYATILSYLKSNNIRYFEVCKDKLFFELKDSIGLFNLSNGKKYIFPKAVKRIKVTTMYLDKYENLWVGSTSGMYRYKMRENPFNNITSSLHLNFSDINSISIGKDKEYLISSEEGLCRIDSGLKKYSLFDEKMPHIFPRGNAFIYVGNGYYMIGYRGVNLINFEKRIFLYMHPDPSDTSSLSDWVVWNLNKSKQGDIWISTMKGPDLMTKEVVESIIHGDYPSNTPFRINPKLIRIFKNTEIRNWHSYVDKENNTWFSTSNGFISYNKVSKTINKYSLKNNIYNRINSLTKDSKGRLWLATEGGGMILYNEKDSSVMVRNFRHGIHDVVWSVQEDAHGYLWLSTNNGIRRYNPDNDEAIGYYVQHGLPGNQLIRNGVCVKDDGKIMMATSSSVFEFHPDDIKPNTTPPDVLISKIWLYNNPVKVGDVINYDLILEKSLLSTEKIVLSYRNKVISFEFKILHFDNPENNKGRYKLDGFDTEWNEFTGNTARANYSNLAPGKYVLRVQGANAYDIWAEQEKRMLLITILPPFWETLWFRILVSLLIISIIVIVFFWRVREIRLKNILLQRLVEERTEEIQAQKEELQVQADELRKANATKDRFFSIIGHDLKNPMYAIKGLSEILIEKPEVKEKAEISEISGMIHKASIGVTLLLENLLTWARSQSGKIQPKYEMLNVHGLVSDIINLLQPGADKKGLRLINNVPTESKVYADEKMLHTIIRNIISNSVKFTDKGAITVNYSYENNRAVITISDTGVGMDENTRNNLFRIDSTSTTQGTQGESGTGLGLIICKEFIDANNGSITVKSEPGNGSRFIIYLPLNMI